jgi:hypothetical protein
MNKIVPLHPRMRVQGLVVEDIPDEVLVYDLKRHKAHCLNLTAALVWRRCDGKTTASEIARRVSIQLDAPFEEEFVWLALRQLDKLHLLESSPLFPPSIAGISRRALIRNLGIAAAVAVPLVTSIVSPTPAQASTCAGHGQVCGINGLGCCSGLACPGTNVCP